VITTFAWWSKAVVQEADGGGVFGEEPAPLVERPVAGHADRTPLVRARPASVIERG